VRRVYHLVVLAALAASTACSSPDSRVVALTSTTARAGVPSPTTRPLETLVDEFFGSTSTSAPTVAARPDGCRDQPIKGKVSDEKIVDVDGDGLVDRVRTVAETPPIEVTPLVLQIAFGDGRFSAPAAVQSQQIHAVVDLDGDGRGEVFVAHSGATAHHGQVHRLVDCRLAVVHTESGEPFEYLYYASGNSCAPACYAGVECDLLDGSVEVVEFLARPPRAIGTVSSPPLTDDLTFVWQIERWSLRDGVMALVESQEGTARHADLPVPKRDGVECAV
jgi:hypothetical protein